MTDATFDEKVLQSSTPVLVDFWAPWCGKGCFMLAPIIEELDKEYAGKLKVLKMDVDKNPETTGEFDIENVPTVVIFKDGDNVTTINGAVPKDKYAARIAKTIS